MDYENGKKLGKIRYTNEAVYVASSESNSLTSYRSMGGSCCGMSLLIVAGHGSGTHLIIYNTQPKRESWQQDLRSCPESHEHEHIVVCETENNTSSAYSIKER